MCKGLYVQYQHYTSINMKGFFIQIQYHEHKICYIVTTTKWVGTRLIEVEEFYSTSRNTNATHTAKQTIDDHGRSTSLATC